MAIQAVTSIPYGKYCQKFHFRWLESKKDAPYRAMANIAQGT